jgi:hypothetical protein
MGMHYFLQGIFAVVGLLAILAAIFNWDWFFNANNAHYIVSHFGRQKARLIYALIGAVSIAVGGIFFYVVQL